MASRDPLDQIMGSLRRSGTVDSGTSQVRESRMKIDRTRAGASPGQTQSLGKPPIQPGRPRQQIRPANPAPAEFGGPGTEMSQDPNLVATLVDQLNESIISIKIQVQKELNPEVRSKLERTAQELRQHILDLGGQPIEAEESVDEGIQQLQGRGFIGKDTLDFTLNDLSAYNKYSSTVATTVPVSQQSPIGTSTYRGTTEKADPGMLKEPGVHKTSHAYERIPSPTPRDTLEKTLAGIGAAKAPSAPSTGSGGMYTTATRTPTETFQYNPPPTNGTGHVGIRAIVEGLFPDGGISVSWDSKTGQVVVSGPAGDSRITPSSVKDGVSFASESEIIAAAVKAGAAELALRPGASIIVDGKVIQQPSYNAPDISDVKQFMAEMGVDVDGRMTEEEYIALRQLETEKGYMQSIHTWNTAIEKFKNDSGAAYNVASRKIGEQASKLKGERQEEMASRGMYYSSVMSGALATVDNETMNLLSDIAVEAANRTAEMGMEVTRLQELQILDETLSGAQARLEYQDRSDQLVQVGLAVQQQLTEMALHEFNANWQEYTWSHQQNIQYWQETAERVYRQEGEVSVVRWALGDPYVVAELKKHGALGAVRNSTPEEAARILSNVLNVSVPMRLNQESHDMNLAVQASQISLNRAYIKQMGIDNARANAEAKTTNWVNEYLSGNITNPEMIAKLQHVGLLPGMTGGDTSPMGMLTLLGSMADAKIDTPQGKAQAAALSAMVSDAYHDTTESTRRTLDSSGINFSTGTSVYDAIYGPTKVITSKPISTVESMSNLDAYFFANASYRN